MLLHCMYDSYLKRRSQIAIDRVIEAFVLELPETDNDDLLALQGLLEVRRVRAFVVGPQGPNLIRSETIEYFCLLFGKCLCTDVGSPVEWLLEYHQPNVKICGNNRYFSN